MKINLTVLDAYQTASNAMAEAYAAYKVARRDFEDMMDGAA